MDCHLIREKLQGYLDGELGPDDTRAVAEHLASCGGCSAELEDLRKTVSSLRGLSEVDPPAWLAGKVMTRIRGERPRIPFFQRLFYPLHIKVPLQAAATVLVAVATIYVFRTMQHEIPPEESLRPQPVPELSEKKGTAEEARKTPRVKEATPAEAPGHKTAPPLPEPAVRTAPEPPAAPAQPGAAGGAPREERASTPAPAASRHDAGAGKDLKARSEAGGPAPAAPGRLRQAEEGRAYAPAPERAPKKKDGKVIWSDETITADDVAKVTRVVLVQEKDDELVLDVSYFLSPEFDGYATVGVFPDIPDWSVAEARAIRGRHRVSVSVSRIPSSEPGDSTSLRIEIAGYKDHSFIGPLYRRVVPFGKRWGAR